MILRATRSSGYPAIIACLTAAAVLLSTGACLPIPQSVNDGIVIDTEDFEVLFDRYTNSHRDYGCTLQLMTRSEQCYEGFKDVISNARYTIDIETLDFDDDSMNPQDIALEFAQLLVEKARAGVRVRVMLDGMTHAALGSIIVNQTFLAGGIEVREFQPQKADLSTGDLLFRMHKKILVADGARAIIGGSNYGYRYMGPSQWRDTNALLTGPIVTTVQREFDYDWDNRSSKAYLLLSKVPPAPTEGNLTLRLIDQKPSENDFDINNAIIIALRLAKRRIDIEAPYFNPTDWLLRELSDAVARGVDVRVLLNSRESNDIIQVYYADASLFEASLTRGIRLFIWDRTLRTMHSKAMIVDDSLAMIGTYNFNPRSALWDTENAIFSTDPVMIRMVDEMIRADFAEPNILEIDMEWVNSQPPCERRLWDLYGLAAPLF